MSETPQCDYCHVPVAARRFRGARLSGDPLYCCYGCRLAAQITQARGEKGQAAWILTRLGLSVFLSMGVMVFSLSMYGQEMYGLDLSEASPLAVSFTGLIRYILLILATPVFLLLGLPILSSAMGQFRVGIVSTDALIVVGVGAAFLYSYLATVTDAGKVYYETACMILVLVTLGKYLEATSRLKASTAVEALHKLLPGKVSVLRGDTPVAVSSGEIRIGDRVLVAPGQRIPVDGTVEAGRANVDEQVVTGESNPVVVAPGDTVRAGSLSIDGALTVRATAVGSDSTLGRLAALLDEAKRSKGRYERLADRVARFFVPVTVALAAVAAAYGYTRGSVDEAIMSGLAVLLISCPCALGIATPMAIWVSLGRAAAQGLLFRNGEAIETLARVRAVALDKTGTLTTGEPTVAAFVTTPNDPSVERRVLAVAAGLGSNSAHALARSVVAFARGQAIAPISVSNVRTIGGRGVVGHIDAGTVRFGNLAMMEDASAGARIPSRTPTAGVPSRQPQERMGANGDEMGISSQRVTVRLGNLAMMEEASVSIGEELRAFAQSTIVAGRSLACVAENQAVSGVFSFSERLRDEAQPALQELRDLGCSVEVLTGDHAQRAAAIAGELGVETQAALTPDQKIEHLQRMRAERGMVAMVGDGLNDAPALAAADVGIAMGCGADLTRESGTVCLLGNDLRSLPRAIKLARRTVRTIKVNLFWAFFYNAIGMSLAIAGKLSPIFAAIAMVASSLFVATNSLRLGQPAKEEG